MKEYKYKINGQEYKVAVGDIENNIAEVSVNGTTYKVELEQAAAPAPVVKSVKPAENGIKETYFPYCSAFRIVNG